MSIEIFWQNVCKYTVFSRFYSNLIPKKSTNKSLRRMLKLKKYPTPVSDNTKDLKLKDRKSVFKFFSNTLLLCHVISLSLINFYIKVYYIYRYFITFISNLEYWNYKLFKIVRFCLLCKSSMKKTISIWFFTCKYSTISRHNVSITKGVDYHVWYEWLKIFQRFNLLN